MANIKDLMKAFLYENVDEDEGFEEDEEEKVTVESIPHQSSITSSTPVEQPIHRPNFMQEYAPEVMPKIEPAPIQNQKYSILDGLDAESISKPPTPGKGKDRKRHSGSSKMRGPKGGDVNYQSVISPIFGNVSDSNKEFDRVHDAINLPKPDESSEMTKVISPMYGNDRPKASALPEYLTRPAKRKAAPSREEVLGTHEDLRSMMKKEIVEPKAEEQRSQAVEQGSLLEKDKGE